MKIELVMFNNRLEPEPTDRTAGTLITQKKEVCSKFVGLGFHPHDCREILLFLKEKKGTDLLEGTRGKSSIPSSTPVGQCRM